MDYASARGTIQSGDVLLFESHGWISATIRWATRSRYSHAALALWLEEPPVERLLVAESRELRGCRLVPLSSAVAGARVTVMRCVRPLSDVQVAVLTGTALDRLGQPYGWRHIALDAIGRLPLMALAGTLGLFRRLPVVGRLLERLPFGKAYSENDLEDPGTRVKCSTYVALCYRAAGIDLVPNLADRSTDPGDLARSALLAPLLVLD